jgi:hypothetical protein
MWVIAGRSNPEWGWKVVSRVLYPTKREAEFQILT